MVHSLVRVGDIWASEGVFPLPPGLVPSDHLGFSLAVDGDTAALAALDRDMQTGAVYLYERASAGWALVQELVGPAPRLLFGMSLALSGDVLAVGGLSRSLPGDLATQVYVFERVAGAWLPRSTLVDTPAGWDSRHSNIIIRDGLFIAAGPFVSGGPSEIHVFDVQ